MFNPISRSAVHGIIEKDLSIIRHVCALDDITGTWSVYSVFFREGQDSSIQPRISSADTVQWELNRLTDMIQ